MTESTALPRFRARIISGAARGRTLGVPTLNLDLRDVPRALPDGVFACRATVDGYVYPATMHSGPRPTFGDVRSCEIHVIDRLIPSPPDTVQVETVAFLRGIRTFATPQLLQNQMAEDIRQARDILGV